MRCPKCGAYNDKVLDSRATPTPDSDTIRRRRECLKCSYRFTTYERIEYHLPRVIKRDGSREDFDRGKIERGLSYACRKRPIPSEKLNQLINSILVELEHSSALEVSSERIGNLIMARLRELDTVAYVRFASVYLAFTDVSQFIAAVKDVGGDTIPPKKKRAPKKPKA